MGLPLSRTDLPITAAHYAPLLYLIPLVAAIRFGVTQMACRLSARVLGADTTKRRKFGDAVYYSIQYTCLFYLSTRVVLEHKIYPYHYEAMYASYPDLTLFSPDFTTFWMAELSVYIVAVLFLSFESRKDYSDFVVVVAHHGITIFLLWISYQYRHFAIGCVIAWLHDGADIFLESGKAFNYLDVPVIPTVLFVGVLTLWFTLRIVLFGTYVVFPPVQTKCISVIRDLAAARGEVLDPSVKCLSPLANYIGYGAVCVLYAMDIYWFVLIVRIAVRFVRGNALADVRDSEEVLDVDSRHAKKE